MFTLETEVLPLRFPLDVPRNCKLADVLGLRYGGDNFFRPHAVTQNDSYKETEKNRRVDSRLHRVVPN